MNDFPFVSGVVSVSVFGCVVGFSSFGVSVGVVVSVCISPCSLSVCVNDFSLVSGVAFVSVFGSSLASSTISSTLAFVFVRVCSTFSTTFFPSINPCFLSA